MKFLSLKIACILVLVLVPLARLGAELRFEHNDWTAGYVLKLLTYLGVTIGAGLTLRMRRIGVYLVVGSLLAQAFANVLVASPADAERIARLGLPAVLAVVLLITGLIAAVFWACVRPHWQYLK